MNPHSNIVLAASTAAPGRPSPARFYGRPKCGAGRGRTSLGKVRVNVGSIPTAALFQILPDASQGGLSRRLFTTSQRAEMIGIAEPPVGLS